mmetsp:Transcript_10169/g.20534  ORF Transcript_10169/g.20534 Transcript_10169/m.20534 type:complete len:467 (-) Transcript_10169:42-1442(-)|eukprot:CAMPEP_0184678848 /NCGR_PEP_ID=MMETSP0312-20130426/1658_1 /TAXON_ID=31354 /ORGANISM="Compsopogon coeruleus, Strain SAG 36.94" /LENGTH=466 /DNA_ID=CAMNT_0027127909 /DNA_START=85 /DNA_END=1485 /DNA_ORIENTATION=-
MSPNATYVGSTQDDIDLAVTASEALGDSRWVTKEELAKHASRESAWIVIKGRVYDVTGFSEKHPGGEILLTYAGRDATEVFTAFHESRTWGLLPSFYVADEAIAKAADDAPYSSPEYMKDVRAMRTELQKLRAFEASIPYYTYKLLSNLGILALSIILLKTAQGYGMAITSAILLGLFWQQCGWLAHDFLHHQVFVDRVYNNMAGILIGNIFQGFSTSWWKSKHNHHHAVPNVTSTVGGGDPDIDTMPILLWSEKLMEREDIQKLPTTLIKYQKVLYWPVLCMARVSWLIQSATYMRGPAHSFVGGDLMRAVEVAGLVLHYIWYLKYLSLAPSWGSLAVVFILSQAMGGFLIGLVFTVGHNAMEVLTEDEYRAYDFTRLQILTTRDVTPNWFNDWFTGGLGYQIEHHLWPTLPRHSLPKAAKILQAFCAKYDIAYSCKGLIEGNVEVSRLLARLEEETRHQSHFGM